MDNTSRRDFIQQTAVLAGGALAGGVTPAAAQAPAAGASRSLPRGAALRALFKKPGVHVAPEAFSVRAAMLAESHGFEVLYIGGAMMSGLHLGLSDWGLITMTEMVEISGRIADSVSIPVIADADQAGETALNVYRTAKSFSKRGVAACHIEDSVNPKHMGGAGNRLQPVEEWVERLTAAVEGRDNPDFVVIARTDAFFNAGQAGAAGAKSPEVEKETIRRGIAAAKAGADAFMIVNLLPDAALFDRIGNAVGLPLIDIFQPVRLAEKSSRYKISLHPTMWSRAMSVYETMLEDLKKNGELPRPGGGASSTAGTTAAPARPTVRDDTAAYRRIADRWATVRK